MYAQLAIELCRIDCLAPEVDVSMRTQRKANSAGQKGQSAAMQHTTRRRTEIGRRCRAPGVAWRLSILQLVHEIKAK